MYTPTTNIINSKLYQGNDCVEVDTGYTSLCWIWRKAKSKAGYGMVTLSKKQYYVHVLNYVDKYGSMPDGLEIDHLCGTRSCVNPNHLEAVTHTENVRRGDRVKLTPELIMMAKIRVENGESRKDVAASYGVDASIISDALNGRIWKGVL